MLDKPLSPDELLNVVKEFLHGAKDVHDEKRLTQFSEAK